MKVLWVAICGAAPDSGVYRIEPGRYVIGRLEDCDIHLSHRSVSRRHAKLVMRNDEVEVEDLGSTNGTYVNGERVTRARVGIGSSLCIGRVGLEILEKMPPPRTIGDADDETPAPAQGGQEPTLSLSDLPPKRKQVVRLWLAGCSKKQIAARLDVTENTVRWHTKQLYAEYDAHSRVQLAARVQAVH